MNHPSIPRFIRNSNCLILSSFLLLGCGQEKPKAGKETHEAHDDHGAEASGATYQEGKGISLSEETRKSLDLEVMEVVEQDLLPTVSLTAQIYRKSSEPSRIYGKERSGNAYATALVSKELTTLLSLGQTLSFAPKSGNDSTHKGTVWKIDSTQIPALGKAEALLELPDPDNSLAPGDFIEAKLPLGKAPQKVVSIPRSALLETSTGRYAFVQNGSFLLRTEIKTGSENESAVEVTEGLYEGDVFAVKPVEALYLIELRATKGGGHCH